MRVFLPDPGLKDRRGHHYAHAWAIAQECENRAIPFYAISSKDVSSAVIKKINCKPLFRNYFYASGPRKLAVTSVINDVFRAAHFLRDLTIALESTVASDVVLLNNVNCSFLAGYLRWLIKRPRDGRPSTVLALRFSPDDGLSRGHLPRWSRAVNRQLFNRLAVVSNGRLLLGTDTALIADEFAELLGREIVRLPLPLKLPQASLRVRNDEQIRLVYLGNPFRERGFHLLPGALSEAFKRVPNLSATVQVSRGDYSQSKRFSDLVSRLRDLQPRVTIIEQELEQRKFYQHLADADAVLLPYDPKVYAKKSSQVLVEASGLARPVIVTRGSFLDREVREYNMIGTVCERFESDALAEAIVSFVERRDRLLDQAWRRCDAMRRLNSASAFVDCLEAVAQSRSSSVIRSAATQWQEQHRGGGC